MTAFRHSETGAGAAVHRPVMLDEVIDCLRPAANETYLDGTFGAGGYSAAILTAADCFLYAIDRDPEAIERGAELSARMGRRLVLVGGCFGDMDSLLAAHNVSRLDGVVLDLGVSSPQIDRAERGFSFKKDGPLDMRMSLAGPSASDVVNNWSELDLGRVIRDYGEERFSRRVARAIVKARSDAPIETTARLAEIVRASLPRPKSGGRDIDPATRTFQALRIQVNDELGELERGLVAAERLLAPGGRLVVVSFHSLEDRRVKAFLRTRSGRAANVSRHMPEATSAPVPTFQVPPRQPVLPTDREAADNPRARSARLRWALRTEAPVANNGARKGKGRAAA